MIAQFFEFVLSSFRLDIVKLLLGLLQVVFQQLEELNTRVLWLAANSSFWCHYSEFRSVTSLLGDQEGVDFWCVLTHLVCNVRVLLGHFGGRRLAWHGRLFTLSVLTLQLSAFTIVVD